jgi:hypothetical protein
MTLESNWYSLECYCCRHITMYTSHQLLYLLACDLHPNCTNIIVNVCSLCDGVDLTVFHMLHNMHSTVCYCAT